MRFTKHKVLLGLLLLMLPPTLMMACLQTPQVSEVVLRFSLKVARLRTGLRVNAESWSVSPLAFSVDLRGARVQLGDVQVEAPLLRARVSPLFLVFGRLHLREVLLEDARVSGPETLARKMLDDAMDGDKAAPKSNGKRSDPAASLGAVFERIEQSLKARNLSVDRLRARNLNAGFGKIGFASLNLSLENLERGQARLEWELRDLKLAELLGGLRSFEGSLAVLKNAQRKFYLAVQNLRAEAESAGRIGATVNGLIPGQSRVRLEIDFAAVKTWIDNSQWLRAHRLWPDSRGVIEADMQLSSEADRVDRVEAHVRTENLRFWGFHPHNITAKLVMGPKDLGEVLIQELELRLPPAAGDKPQWKGRIHAKGIRFGKEGIRGQVHFDEAGLCGILVATDVPECQSSTVISGSAQLEGQLEPFQIIARPELRARDGQVLTGIYHRARNDQNPEEDLLVNVHDFTAGVGYVDIREKYLDLVGVKAIAPEAEVTVDSRIHFNPPKVEMTVKSTTARAEKLVKDFLGVPIGGVINSTTNINFDRAQADPLQRTKVSSAFSVDQVSLFGQMVGQLSGSLNYTLENLNFPALLLRSGGGRAELSGTLHRSQGGRGRFVELGAKLDRLEVAMRSEEGSEVFRGFVNGTASVSGPPRADQLKGQLRLSAQNLKAFSLPFQSAQLEADFSDRALRVRSLKAKQGLSEVSVGGILKSAGGSELSFESGEMPLSTLSPRLAFLQQGRAVVKGWWRPREGFRVEGALKALRVADAELGDGTFYYAGVNDEANGRLQLPSLKFEFAAHEKKNGLTFSKSSGEATEVGVYALLAYIKDWRKRGPVRVSGGLGWTWSPHEGEIHLRDLQLLDTQNASAAALLSSGNSSFAWKNGLITRNQMNVSGSGLRLQVKGAPGDRVAACDVNLDLRTLGVFVPGATMRKGNVQLQALVPMPPRLATFQASGTVQDGNIDIDGLGEALQRVRGRVDIRLGQLALNDIEADMGGGSVALKGVYTLDPDKPALLLESKLDRAHVVIGGSMPLDLSGDITLSGSGMPYQLAGQLRVVGGTLSRDYGADEESLAQSGEPRLNFALNVDVGNGFAFRNSIANTEARGRLQVGGTDRDPQFKGRLELGPGAVISRGTEFSISQGSIEFPGGSESPLISMQAQTRVSDDQTYQIQLRASGRIDNLTLDLSSQPTLSTQEIVNLLTFGSRGTVANTTESETSRESLRGDTLTSGAGTAEALNALFGNAINKSLNRSVGVNLRLSAARSRKSDAEFTTIPKVTLSRRLSDRVTATYGQSLEQGTPEQDLKVDYRVLNNMNLTGVWESVNTEGGVSNSSYGADVRFKFDLK